MNPVWTEERLAELRDLAGHPDKYSARKIAEMLHVKRNAVIGACFRNGIKLRNESNRPATPRPSKPKAKRQKSPKLWKPKPTEAPVEIELATADVVSRDVDLMSLGEHDCRYPTGDGPFLFCGNPVHGESNYCLGHHRLCWVKPTKFTPSTYRDKPRKAA